jgi:hypothetical protein
MDEVGRLTRAQWVFVAFPATLPLLTKVVIVVLRPDLPMGYLALIGFILGIVSGGFLYFVFRLSNRRLTSFGSRLVVGTVSWLGTTALLVVPALVLILFEPVVLALLGIPDEPVPMLAPVTDPHSTQGYIERFNSRGPAPAGSREGR